MEITSSLKACQITAGAVSELYKGSKALSDKFLMRKIEAFAKEPFSEKSKKFINKIDADKFEEIQEQIIHVLTQAESVIKALYAKRLTEAYCEQNIDWSTYCRMSFILSQVFTYDFVALVKYYNNEFDCEVTQNKLNQFAQLGLIDYNLYGDNDTPWAYKFLPNDLGRSFIRCVLFDIDANLKTKIEDKRKVALNTTF